MRVVIVRDEVPLRFSEHCRIAADFLRGKGHQIAAEGGVSVWRFDEIEVSDLGLIALTLLYKNEWLDYLSERKATRAA